jgi:hypothetical protein
MGKKRIRLSGAGSGMTALIRASSVVEVRSSGGRSGMSCLLFMAILLSLSRGRISGLKKKPPGCWHWRFSGFLQRELGRFLRQWPGKAKVPEVKIAACHFSVPALWAEFKHETPYPGKSPQQVAQLRLRLSAPPWSKRVPLVPPPPSAATFPPASQHCNRAVKQARQACSPADANHWN